MIKDEFVEQFYKLVNAFGATKPEQKLDIYFEKLSHLPFQFFEKTVQKILNEHEKFPSIAKILEVSRIFQVAKERGSCTECAEGFVTKWKHTFRCRCIHGQRLPNYITQAPVTPDERKRVYGRLNKEYRDLYGKDLVEGKSYVEPLQQELSPIVAKAVDMFGATVIKVTKGMEF